MSHAERAAAYSEAKARRHEERMSLAERYQLGLLEGLSKQQAASRLGVLYERAEDALAYAETHMQKTKRALVIEPPASPPNAVPTVKLLGMVPDGNVLWSVVEVEVPLTSLKVRRPKQPRDRALDYVKLELTQAAMRRRTP